MTAWAWVAAVILVLAVIYLPQLGIGLGQIFLFLLVLACPLLHFLGGHRHGGHGSAQAPESGLPDRRRTGPPDRGEG